MRNENVLTNLVKKAKSLRKSIPGLELSFSWGNRDDEIIECEIKYGAKNRMIWELHHRGGEVAEEQLQVFVRSNLPIAIVEQWDNELRFDGYLS